MLFYFYHKSALGNLLSPLVLILRSMFQQNARHNGSTEIYYIWVQSKGVRDTGATFFFFFKRMTALNAVYMYVFRAHFSVTHFTF